VVGLPYLNRIYGKHSAWRPPSPGILVVPPTNDRHSWHSLSPSSQGTRALKAPSSASVLNSCFLMDSRNRRVLHRGPSRSLQIHNEIELFLRNVLRSPSHERRDSPCVFARDSLLNQMFGIFTRKLNTLLALEGLSGGFYALAVFANVDCFETRQY
jgi:hypothetical protein